MTGFRAPARLGWSAPTPPSIRTEVPTDQDLAVIAQVLHGLHFPARAWQIVTTAETYGADAHTREQFGRLPTEVSYDSLRHVGAVCAGLPTPARPGCTRTPVRTNR